MTTQEGTAEAIMKLLSALRAQWRLLPRAVAVLTQFDVHPVRGGDHSWVLVGGGRRREPGVGGGGVAGVAHGLDQVQLPVPLHLVPQPIDQHPSPGGLVQGRAGETAAQLG